MEVEGWREGEGRLGESLERAVVRGKEGGEGEKEGVAERTSPPFFGKSRHICQIFVREQNLPRPFSGWEGRLKGAGS